MIRTLTKEDLKEIQSRCPQCGGKPWKELIQFVSQAHGSDGEECWRSGYLHTTYGCRKGHTWEDS